MTEQASKTQPARPVQSREVKTPAKAILEIIEDHDWLKDFESDEEGTHRTDESPHPSFYTTPPVLKVTGGLRDDDIVDSQSALKVADGNSASGKRSSSPDKMCRVNHIRVASPVVEKTSDNDRQVVVISPVRPSREKRLKLELSRVDLNRPVQAVTAPLISRRRIPTTEWVSREAKGRAGSTGRTGVPPLRFPH